MPFDGTKISQVTESLISGRRRLEAGWCQNTCQTRRWEWPGRVVESFCMIGAGGDPESLLRAIRRLGYDPRDVPAFNDAPWRTKEEVLAVYDEAIGASF
jgi:hypothetical protein